MTVHSLFPIDGVFLACSSHAGEDSHDDQEDSEVLHSVVIFGR